MPVVTILLGFIVLALIVIFALVRKCSSLSEALDMYVAEDKSRNTDMSALSKFKTLASELSQLRKIGLSDRKYFFKTVLDCACMLINSGRGSLMLYDEAYDELIIIAARNIEKETAENVRIKLGEGIAGRAFKTGEVIYVTNPETNTQYTGFANRPEQQDPFISVPIKTNRRSYCVLNLHLTSKKTHFTDYDLRLLSLLADEAGLIIENDRLSKAINSK